MANSNDGKEDREQQLDAIAAEYYRALDAGTRPNEAEFIARYPDHSTEVREFFADLRMFPASELGDDADPALEPTLTPNTSRQKNSPVASVVRYFGEYEILEELGAGGMGVVYKARQTKLKRIVAIKMIRSGELANSQDVQRFEAEAKAAAKLSHPGIVSVHEVGIHNGQHFYTMDYVEGGSLSRLHRDKPVASKHAAKLVRRLAESMHYAHQQNIIHRDLKPANILLTAKGAPRITDFGLAKRLRTDDGSHAPTMTESGQILGTAGYMSPEQAAGKSRLVGPVSDVYSLGAVLYALITGHAPFVGETPSHTILQVLQKDPISPRRINPNVPRDLETICLKCLAKEPHKRYGTAQLLADDLRLFLEGKPVKARPVSSIERSWRWCRRNSVLTALLAVILLVVLSLPILAWHQVMTIVDGVQEARGGALPELISDLRTYPSSLVTAVLIGRFENEPEPDRKLNLAFALATFGTGKSEYLVSQVGAVAGDDTRVLFEGLNIDRQASLKFLQSGAVESTRENNWRRKSQLAILALHLGDSALAVDMCQIENRPDPTQRTLFINEFPKWHVNTKTLAEVVKSSRDSGFCSAVLLGTGLIPHQRLSLGEKQAWRTLAEQWHVAKADAITHSATGSLLRRWNLPLPEIATGAEPIGDVDWRVNSQGQAFLRIPVGSLLQRDPSGGQDRYVTFTESFWMSDREVTAGQFQRFISDANYPASEKPTDWGGVETVLSPTPDHPVQNTNWSDVMLYCNWLSVQEGFIPVYQNTDAKMKYQGKDLAVWQSRNGANGYRVPLEIEWEYACRAGSITQFSCGDDEELLKAYSPYHARRPAVCGAQLPNGWGLFDMHGNVAEMCGYSNTTMMSRGGAYNYSAENQRVDYRVGYGVGRSNMCGFRLVRGVRDFPQTDTSRASSLPNSAPTPSSDIKLLKAFPVIESGRAITSVQHSLDNSLVLLGGYERFAGLFGLKEQKEQQVFRGHANVVWSVALSPDGQTAVTGSEDKTLKLWDVATGQELDPFTADGIFSCVRYSADGQSVFATNWDGKVRIWKPSEGKLGDRIEFTYPNAPLDIAMMPDQKQFVIGTASGQILLCDAETGVVQKKFDGHSGWVHSVVVLDSGKRLLSAGHDATLRLWDVDTATADRVYLGHSGVVNEVRVLSDGKRFLSCGADRTVRLWDVDSRRELARGIGSGELRGLSVAPDGKSCVTAGLDGSLWEWELPETSEASSDSTDRNIPQMLTSDAFQADFIEKHKLLLRPMHLFLEVDPATNLPFYAIDWGPANGHDFIVHHGMSDLTLEQNEAQAVLQGYKRTEVKTVTIDGVNHHIGLWTK